MPYNYKIHTAQQSQQEAQDELKEMGLETAKEMAGAIGSDVAATALVGAAVPAASGALANPAIAKGIGTYMAAKGGLALAEEMQGAKKIFNDYYSDYNKLLDALSKTFPQNAELQQVVNLGKNYGQKAYQAMSQAQIQDPNLFQAIGTGVNTGVQTINTLKDTFSSAAGGNQQPPASAASVAANFNYKNYRLAIVGDYGDQIGKYVNEAGSAALAGGAMAGGWGALAGGIGMLGWEAGKDIYHNMQSKAYQAAAYTNELKRKGASMVAQLKKFNPEMALAMYRIIQQIDLYVQSKIYGNKKKQVSQEFMSMLANPQQQQAIQEQQAQEQAQQQGQQGTNPTQDVEFQNGIQTASQAYNYAQSLIGQPGMEQQYELYKNEYNVILQQLNQYLATNYPNVNADETIAAMMGAR
jgi:hypothetical protein